jgi:hypothetical protein
MQGLTLYVMDLAPGVSADVSWRASIAFLVMEAIVKIAVIREIFSDLVNSPSPVARTGKCLIVCAGIVLVVLAAEAAARAPAVPNQMPSYAPLCRTFGVGASDLPRRGGITVVYLPLCGALPSDLG